MSWPLASHFSTMLQNPRIAFRDPALRQCSIEKDERNQPRPWAGAFAVVYKGIDAATREPFAVRVFTTESPERRERYDLISAYLKGRKLDCLVDFEYRDRSIRSASDGKWYPLILMDWVQGDTLFKWARERCLEGNTAALAAAARCWVKVVKELGEACVAHGDLQHANVMVTPSGEVKLVDYDCMCVPALAGRRNLEVGVEPYQHPDRNEATLLSPDLDNFSALMIYVALRALAAEPALWHKYIEQTGYDKLLFRPEDLRAGGNSALYHDLMNSPEQDVRDLGRQLFELARVPMDQVPPLGHLANSYAKVEQLLLRQDWEGAVDALNRRGQFRDAPDHLKPLITQAYEHVCRRRAWTAFQKLPEQTSEANDRRLLDAWNESLFAGFPPAETQRVRVASARHRVEILDRLYHIVGQSLKRITGDGERQIVQAADRLPQGYAYSLQARVEQARGRVRVIARLEKALADPVNEAAIVAAWRAAVEAKCDGLLPADRRPRIELAARRSPLMKKLHEIPHDLPADERDRRILDLWQEDLLKDCREAERWRPAYELAFARQEVLRRLKTAIEGGDQSAAIELMADPCLADYPLPAAWTAMQKAAREQTERTETLLAALRDQQRATFCEFFDARIIRRSAEQFSAYEPLLCQWIHADVLPLERLGLRAARRRAALVPMRLAADSYRVQWTWPDERYVDRCMLAVCPAEPRPDDGPSEVPIHLSLPIDRQGWESGGGSQVIRTRPDWAGGYVVVWAVVDLGFRAFYSPPLVLGRLEERARRSWTRWGIIWPRRSRAPTEGPQRPKVGPGQQAATEQQ